MIVPYAAVIIRLLQGVIYNDDRDRDLWGNLIRYQPDIRDYFERIGVILHVNESEGFAFLKQRKFEPDQDFNLPSLVERRHLSYPVTLLCVLLVEELVKSESKGESARLIVGTEEIKETLRTFLPEKSNEAKLLDSIDTHINKLVEFGFLRELKDSENKYEVKRILKDKVPAETLQELKNKLEEYARQHIE